MKISNLQNSNRKYIKSLGGFNVLEYVKDVSVSPENVVSEYYMSEMNIRRRQVVIEMDNSSVVIQAGAMQWMAGDIHGATGVKGVKDFMGKLFKGAVTKETAIMPEYFGSGLLVLEPTYKYILLMEVARWGDMGVTIEKGMFLACDSGVTSNVVSRKNASSAIMGGEGFFNMSLSGHGIVALESNVPQEELIAIDLEDDVLKIDGSLAVCWSTGLDFTVEKATSSLLGSAVSGEGLVNVYRGTGRVLMCPVAATESMSSASVSRVSDEKDDDWEE